MISPSHPQFVALPNVGYRLSVSVFAPCKGIQDSLGFWIPYRGFQIPDTAFQFLSVELRFWIPIVIVGFQIPRVIFRNPDSFTWSELLLVFVSY